MIGNRFGKLVVVAECGTDKWHNRLFTCKCDCGGESVVAGCLLRNGNTKSCGCLKRSVLGDSSRTHGARKTRAYYSWWNMKSRCERPNSKYFADYGGRGIKICDRWNSFDNFLSDMGQPAEGETLERVNNDLGYSPDNCRWVDRKTQANNRRSSVFYEVYGARKTLQQWADLAGISRTTISARIKAGWDIDRAILTPKVK